MKVQVIKAGFEWRVGDTATTLAEIDVDDDTSVSLEELSSKLLSKLKELGREECILKPNDKIYYKPIETN